MRPSYDLLGFAVELHTEPQSGVFDAHRAQQEQRLGALFERVFAARVCAVREEDQVEVPLRGGEEAIGVNVWDQLGATALDRCILCG